MSVISTGHSLINSKFPIILTMVLGVFSGIALTCGPCLAAPAGSGLFEIQCTNTPSDGAVINASIQNAIAKGYANAG